jgi:hypothetical protein
MFYRWLILTNSDTHSLVTPKVHTMYCGVVSTLYLAWPGVLRHSRQQLSISFIVTEKIRKHYGWSCIVATRGRNDWPW